MKRFTAAVILFSLGIYLFASGSQEESVPDDVLRVFVSIPPQKFFVERIGGDLVRVDVLIGENQDPHTFEPLPSQITGLSKADLYLQVGINFEEAFIGTLRRTLPDLEILDISKGVELIEAEDHLHTETPDPHFWMGPAQAVQMAAGIRNALIVELPGDEEKLRENYDALVSQIENLDKELTEILLPYRGSTLFVYHPAFGYFAHSYGLVQTAVETGGKEPSPRQLESIITKAKTENVKIIFVQPQFSARSAQVIADATGSAVVRINQLAENWLENMKEIGLAIKEGLE